MACYSKRCCIGIYVTLGIFFALGSVALGICSFVYDDWVRYSVTGVSSPNSPQKKTDIIYYNRARGIFAMRFSNSSFKPEFLPDGSMTMNLGTGEDTNLKLKHITDLRKAHLGTFASAFILTAISTLIALGSMLQHCVSKRRDSTVILRPVSIICGLLFLLAAIAYFVSYVVFHILMDEERLTLGTTIVTLYAEWTEDLKKGTIIYYYSMYYAGWGATLLVILSAIVFLTNFTCCHHSRPLPSNTPNYSKSADPHYMISPGSGAEMTTIPSPHGHHNNGYGNSSPPTLARGGGFDDGQSQHSLVSGGGRRLPRHQVEQGVVSNPGYQSASRSANNNNNIYRIY